VPPHSCAFVHCSLVKDSRRPASGPRILPYHISAARPVHRKKPAKPAPTLRNRARKNYLSKRPTIAIL